MPLASISPDRLASYRTLLKQREDADEAYHTARRAASSEDEENTLRKRWGAASIELNEAVSALLRDVPTVTAATLTKTFDRYAVAVLMARNFIIAAPEPDDEDDGKRKRRIRRFIFIEKPPTADAYVRMRDQHYTCTAADLVSDAFSTFESLRDELDEWYNNLPENLQESDKGYRIEEAKDAMEEAANYQFDPDDTVAELSVRYFPSDENSRNDQNCAAIDRLRTVAEAARDRAQALCAGEVDGVTDDEDECEERTALDECAEDDTEGRAAATARLQARREKLAEALEELANKCEEPIDHAESAEFPGMYD